VVELWHYYLCKYKKVFRVFNRKDVLLLKCFKEWAAYAYASVSVSVCVCVCVVICVGRVMQQCVTQVQAQGHAAIKKCFCLKESRAPVSQCFWEG